MIETCPQNRRDKDLETQKGEIYFNTFRAPLLFLFYVLQQKFKFPAFCLITISQDALQIHPNCGSFWFGPGPNSVNQLPFANLWHKQCLILWDGSRHKNLVWQV